MVLSRSDLLALARKYRTLTELRRTQYEATALEARGSLRRLSREFPGSLRELDTLPLTEIERRAALLERAAAEGVVEAWMEWMHAYHATMRAALGVKRRLSGRRVPTAVVAARIASELGAERVVDVDVDFVRAVAKPPEGRINVLVFQRLEARFGARSATIARTLFPEQPR